jgi:hypothetical protein
MNVNAKLGLWTGLLLTILCAGSSTGQSVPAPAGTAAAQALAPAGVDAGRWQRLVLQLKARGLSMDSIHECLTPVQTAAREGLPADPVMTRIEEGAAKGVEGNALQTAARQRLMNLQKASAVLRQAGYADRNASNDQLMKSVTLALENGLSDDTLRGVFARAKNGQAERLRSIVEAGETMRLSGMDEATVGSMMTDFTERNMRRTEIMRASRFAVRQHGAHVEGERIRRQLWDGSGTGGRWGSGGNTPGTAGSGAETPFRGNGPAASGATSGQGTHSPSPGNAPADAGTGGGGPAGGGPGGPSGSSGQGGNGPGGAGATGSTQSRRP